MALGSNPDNLSSAGLRTENVMQVADDEIYLVVNAGCREKDLAHIGKHLDKFTVSSVRSPESRANTAQRNCYDRA